MAIAPTSRPIKLFVLIINLFLLKGLLFFAFIITRVWQKVGCINDLSSSNYIMT